MAQSKLVFGSGSPSKAMVMAELSPLLLSAEQVKACGIKHPIAPTLPAKMTNALNASTTGLSDSNKKLFLNSILKLNIYSKDAHL